MNVEVVVAKILKILKQEFSKKAWNSILQLAMGGGVIYLITVIVGPSYGCGAGNAQIMENMFTCTRGEMAAEYKALILGGILLASLCWGRAATLYEKRRAVGSGR